MEINDDGKHQHSHSTLLSRLRCCCWLQFVPFVVNSAVVRRNNLGYISVLKVREPLPLIVHHLPIAVTFAVFTDDSVVVIDSSHLEEAILKGRMTVTLNTNGDICAIQKGEGVGVMHSVVLECLRVASVKAADKATKIKEAVESYNT